MKFLGSIVEGDGWIGKIYKLDRIKFDLSSLQSIDLNKYPYLLESSSRGNKKNRYSILFFKPTVYMYILYEKINFSKVQYITTEGDLK